MRFGIDLGGTKTEILALGQGGSERWRKRVPTARDFHSTVQMLAELVREAANCPSPKYRQTLARCQDATWHDLSDLVPQSVGDFVLSARR